MYKNILSENVRKRDRNRRKRILERLGTNQKVSGARWPCHGISKLFAKCILFMEQFLQRYCPILSVII
jgi:hypothetical protein